MSRSGWKAVERDAAELFGGRRCWANSGGRTDVEGEPGKPFHFAVQVKNPKRMSLAELERLVDEMTLVGIDEGKVPAVYVKRSARAPTQPLVLVPACAFKILHDAFRARLALLAPSEPGGPAPDLRDVVRGWARANLCEYPGMRRRVADYVEKSKARARGTTVRTKRWRANDGGEK